MKGTPLYWATGPWPGRLALAARPRGGEWLDDEIQHWQREGIGAVLSLLTPDEEKALDLTDEASTVRKRDLVFYSFPIVDRDVPTSSASLTQAVRRLDTKLEAGYHVVIHCRQGAGRAGLVAACLLVMNGSEPEAAVQHLTSVRGVPVPETPEQRRWIDQYAETVKGNCRLL